MATLLNPLDKFASYSIHHVVLLCRTTEEAKVFTDESQNVATLAAINQVDQLGDSVPFGQSQDTAFLVMDTRRFSQFAVDNMKYDVFINGVEASGSHGNLATTVTMTIIDNIGISFINFLQWLMDEKMKTNFDGMIFMHRLLFIGHLPDGTSDTVQTITIPMYLNKLELSLEHSKGVYNAEFLPNMNFDVRKGDRWLNISSATRYFSGTENTLGSMVESFESVLNQASSDYFNKAKELLKGAGREVGNQRLVKYMITLPKDWAPMKFTGSATAAATEKVFAKKIKEKTGQTDTPETKKPAAKESTPKDTHLAVEPGILITDVLRIMLDQVQGIAELGVGKKTPNAVVFYKLFVGITSDDDIVIVHVDVVPFEVPDVVPETEGKSVDQYYKEVDGKRVPINYAEFDYIFTGNNKDILNFDMKMSDLTYFLASNIHIGPAAADGFDDQKKAGEGFDKQAELVTARPFDALLLPKNTTAELDNFSKYAKSVGKEGVKLSQDYTRNLSMYYAMSPITAIMTIRGNPDIMAKFNQQSFLPHINASTTTSTGISTTNTQEKARYREEFEKSILENNTHQDSSGNDVSELTIDNKGVFRVAKTLGKTNYAKSPVFVKVNINGPNVDFRTGAHKMSEDFAKTLIQDNYYVVFKVTNTIQGHTFTQDLELYSHNVFGVNKMTPTETKTI